MKILHVIDSGGLYGAEMVLLALAGEQKKMGHNPWFASIGEPGDYVKPIEAQARVMGLDVAEFRMRNGPNIPGALKIVRFARSLGFDILHSHGYKGDILLGFLPRRVRYLPLVCTVHGWTGVNGFSKMRLYEWVDGLSLRRADAVCLVSGAMRDLPAIRAIDPSKVHVVPNGVPELDLSMSAPEDEIADFCRKGFAVISIGRLSKEKGYDILIEAFSHVHKEHPATFLIIIGEGPDRSRLESIVRAKSLESAVMLPGYRENAWRYLVECGLFVLPSFTEGMPVTLLEALQVGIPIVATRVGGVPGLLSGCGNGLLVPPGDINALASAIKGFIPSQGTAERSTTRFRVEKARLHSPGAMAEAYDELYRRMSPAA